MDVLKTLSPLTILRTLESGVMKPQAARLSANERQALANYLGKPVLNERRREELANPCPASNAPVWKDGPNWASWAPGLASNPPPMPDSPPPTYPSSRPSGC